MLPLLGTHPQRSPVRHQAPASARAGRPHVAPTPGGGPTRFRHPRDRFRHRCLRRERLGRTFVASLDCGLQKRDRSHPCTSHEAAPKWTHPGPGPKMGSEAFPKNPARSRTCSVGDGARDRTRTGDNHVGNVFRALDFAEFSRETTAGSRIGHACVAAMLRACYARHLRVESSQLSR